MTSGKGDDRLTRLDACSLALELAQGRIRAQEVVCAHLRRIEEQDQAIGAFAHIDADLAIKQAAVLDRHRSTGRALGSLHGLPVAIKDIIDVRGLPCEYGTELESGRMPREDAFLVSRLRQAGAVIIGKTVTTELAVYHPGKTRNPHDLSRTPGGSSSGSAAAVAAHMTPLSVGSQTNGSVIRPASYCGVVGYKPSRGLISRRGVLSQSPTLDTMGVFARTVEDAALLADALIAYDQEDRGMVPIAPPRLAVISVSDPPLRPNLAVVRTANWDQAEEDVRAGFAELAEALGEGMETVDLPTPFARAHEMHRTIQLADIAKSYARYYERGRARLSARLVEMIEEGRSVLAIDYALAHDWAEVLNGVLDRLFDRFDAIVTPAADGEAPPGLDSTGSPAFSTIWTYCGVPAITLPLLTGSHGLPVGVQLVGRRNEDARLLRTARWLVAALSGSETGQAAN